MKSVNSVNVNFTAQKKAKKENNRGTLAAIGVSQVASLASLPVSIPAANALCAQSKNLSQAEKNLMNSVIDDVLVKTGLQTKGVKIFDVTSAPTNTRYSGLPDSVREALDTVFATSKGKNAYFTDSPIKDGLKNIIQEGNSIGINRQKLPTATFHEMGHAFNYNCTKFWKFMQKLRMPSMITAALVVPLYCAISKKSKPDEKGNLTGQQKVNNFIRKNSGILAFGAMLPVISEEIMASVRGCKWAYGNLPKNLANKVFKSNIFGAISYIAGAAALGLAAHLTTRVKDRINEKAQAKAQAKANQNANVTAKQKA